MPLISGTVPSLINGVSQQPATLRMPTQGELQENGFSHISRGLEKRPCTEHLAEIAGVTSTDSNDVFIHTIRRSEDEAYALVVKGGVKSDGDWITATGVNFSNDTITVAGITIGQKVKIRSTGSVPEPLNDETFYYVKTVASGNITLSETPGGTEINLTSNGSGTIEVKSFDDVTTDPVIKLYDLTGFATGNPGDEVYIQPSVQTGGVSSSGALDADVKRYLSYVASDSFRPNKMSTTTVADFSFILNKTQAVRKATTTHPQRQYESLGFVKIGDYDGHYKILVTQYDIDSDGEIDRDAPLWQYEVEYDTPQNNTESITSAGTTAASNTVSINNQAAVVVNNIAESLYEGTDNTVKVYVREETGNGDVFISTSSTTVDIADAYDGNVGVRDKGVVSTRRRYYSGGAWGSWVTMYENQAVTANTSTNKFELTSHTLENNDQVVFGGTTLPSGISANTTYYVVNKSTNDFQVAATEGGSAITLGGSPTGVTVSQPLGLKSIQAHRPKSGNGSATSWTTDYTHGESLFYVSADYDETNSYPFDLEASDGKGDANMEAVNGSDEVANFGKLPGSKVPLGFVAKISGDKSTGQDDYYVKWNGSVWKETFRPKYSQIPASRARNKLDNTTMPVQLFKAFDSNDNIYYVLKLIDYGERLAGDDITNPFPSFADYDESEFFNGLYTINDIFFHRNRLGFISDENVILSEAANYFNYFANTVLSVLDTSVVDVAVSNNQVAILKSAIPFQETLLLFSDLQQFKLGSDEFLTPTSVTVDVATNFETSTDAKPVAAGKTIFFPFQRGAFSGIREYFIDVASETNDANEVTSHVPDYIQGVVKKMAVSSNEELLCVLSDNNRKELIVYKYYYSDQEKLQSSWSKWVFDAEIIDMEFIGSVAYMLFRRGTKIYLEKLNLSVDIATNTMDDKIGVRLDRRVALEQGAVTTVPYSDVQHDKVGTTVRANGVNGGEQFGKRIAIDGVDVAPRVGQTFTSAHDAINVYTVTAVGTLANNEIEIEITPSIAPEPSIDQGGPIPDDTILTFSERDIVYVVETGEVISSAQVAGVLAEGTTYSQSKGNNTPIVFAGIPYDFKYEFSEQFVKSGENSINSGRLQMRNFEISYDRTGFFEVEVSPKPYDNRLRKIFKRTFTGRRIGSLFLGKQELDTGVFRVPVYVNSKDVKITVLSDSWLPLSLQSADYEAFQVLRNQRI